MSKPQERGIAGILDRILSPSEPGQRNPVDRDCIPSLSHDQPGSKVPLHSASFARRGRPPGKASATAPKEKITVRIAAEVISSYRDWSWQARSQLSHLVEQALREYQERNH
jgi:uncharacterized protein (DUF4415 family)